GDAVERLLGLGVLDEHEVRRAEHQLVAVLEHDLADARAAYISAVQRAEIAQQEAAVTAAKNLRVLLRDDAVENLDRIVGMAADGVDRRELELLSLLARRQDQLRHAREILPKSSACVKTRK